MRFNGFLVVACVVLFTQQVHAQSSFHTDWGRHLGWGAGPGYHSYSQDDIHAWMARCAPSHPCATGCDTCSPAFLGNGTVVYSQQPVMADQYRNVAPMPMSNPNRLLPAPPTSPTGPTLAPPQQAPIREPLQLPPAPAAFRPPHQQGPFVMGTPVRYTTPGQTAYAAQPQQIQPLRFQPPQARPMQVRPQRAHPLITPTALPQSDPQWHGSGRPGYVLHW